MSNTEITRSNPNNAVSYDTQCPFCGKQHKLYITKFTLAYHNIPFYDVFIQLEPDGFDIYDEVPEGIRNDDLSTDDEEVTCECCGQTFDLGLVTNE